MRTYYFTIATPGRYMNLAKDLLKSAEKFNIEVEILVPEKGGNEGSKSLKIDGILNAPSWADRIVFLDADTLIVDPSGLENYNGTILEPWSHKEGMYTIEEASKEIKKERLNRLYEKLKERGLSNCIPPYEYGPAEWNSGVIVGDRKFLEDLVNEWRIWWDIVLECNDGKFRRDQISFKYAYVAIHRQKYGFTEDLPREYNWLIKRWGFPEGPKILHKAGRPRSEICKKWDRAKEAIFKGTYSGIGVKAKKDVKIESVKKIESTDGKVWVNPFNICNCNKNCKHSGGMHSYIEHYKRVLDFIKPKKVLEWGPGENTKLALSSGAAVYSIEQKEQYIPKISSDFWQWEIISPKDDKYITHPNGDKEWDLYFVDSRRRQECIDLAFNEGKDGCVVCLHDAQRSRYHKHLRNFNFVKFLHKGFCIASNDQKIMEL